MKSDVPVPVQQNDPKWNVIPTMVAFIAAQAQDYNWWQNVSTVSHLDSKFYVNGYGLLVIQSTIDDAV